MFYVIRHGKTDWNKEYRLQGRTDIPLNEEGKEMARNAAKEYANVHFDICYCSPLTRARETAELLLEGRNVPIIIDERLSEMSFGIYEGTANVYEKPECPVRVLFFEPENYKGVEGGESMEELMARTGNFLEEIVKPGLQNGKDILVVGHGAMNSSIICQVKERPLSDFWKEPIENCKLKLLTKDN